jgi:hypothetical protein
VVSILATNLSAQINVATPSSIPVQHEPTIDMSIKDGIFGDALDAISKADPRFVWQQ